MPLNLEALLSRAISINHCAKYYDLAPGLVITMAFDLYASRKYSSLVQEFEYLNPCVVSPPTFPSPGRSPKFSNEDVAGDNAVTAVVWRTNKTCLCDYPFLEAG